jgi:hypothetical protein
MWVSHSPQLMDTLDKLSHVSEMPSVLLVQQQFLLRRGELSHQVFQRVNSSERD